MKTIKKIFLTDLKNLSKNFFALVVAIGVCFLPALYAWFNIYSNWDPYGNTGALQMAAVCLDTGYTDDEGKYINVGNDIMKDMAKNDKVDWNFVTTKEEAIHGVESGKYYAAVVIEKKFTYNMYNMFIETDKQPTLTFYQNQKKNPVANKISDTIVGNLESKIDEEFIQVMTAAFFEDANNVKADLEKDGGAEKLIEKLENLNNELISYEKMIDKIIAGNGILSANLGAAKHDVDVMKDATDKSKVSLEEASQNLSNTKDNTLKEYESQVKATIDSINILLDDLNDIMSDIGSTGSANVNQVARAQEDISHIQNNGAALQSSLSTASALDEETAATLSAVSDGTNDLSSTINQLLGNMSQEDVDAIVNQAQTDIDVLENNLNTLNSQLENVMSNLELIMKNSSNLMHNMGNVLSSMGDIFGSLQTTLSTTDTSLEKTKDALDCISKKITKALDKAKAVNGDERVKVLVNALSGDPELYGQYFSEPVKIESVAIYPVENYGSAVAPFYTVLSIWVGVIILAAIIKVKINKEKYPEASPTEMFFGRGMFFLFMGQVQTLITVLGDLFILKIQCEHPFQFWIVSALTSLTFTLLIYALVYTFGDVGKAVAVVVLVLQIAGSSGTYPIELLPEFFQKVYIFFPFPYAINAMRECICGFYENDIVVYLLKLLIFLIPALVIGLLLRIPFEELNHYMEKRMEDTEMM